MREMTDTLKHRLPAHTHKQQTVRWIKLWPEGYDHGHGIVQEYKHGYHDSLKRNTKAHTNIT